MKKQTMKLNSFAFAFLVAGMMLRIASIDILNSNPYPIAGRVFWVIYLGLTCVTLVNARVLGVTKKNLETGDQLFRFGLVGLTIGPAWVLFLILLSFYQGPCLTDLTLCLNKSGFGHFSFQLSITFVVAWLLISMILLLGGWGYSNIALGWARKSKKNLV